MAMLNNQRVIAIVVCGYVAMSWEYHPEKIDDWNNIYTIGIPPITMVMTRGWLMTLRYEH